MGKEFMIDQTHGILRESAPEPGKGRIIGRAFIKGNAQKLLEGDSVINLGFQFRIGVDLEPLLEQEAFHEDQQRIGLIALAAFADGITSQKQILDAGPIHDGVDLFHFCDGPVMFHRRKEGNIRKAQVGFHFLEAHKSSVSINFEGNVA